MSRGPRARRTDIEAAWGIDEPLLNEADSLKTSSLGNEDMAYQDEYSRPASPKQKGKPKVSTL